MSFVDVLANRIAGLESHGPGFCCSDANDVVNALGFGTIIPINGPVHYLDSSGQNQAEVHFLVEVVGKFIIDLGHPTQKVYESMDDYLANSGIIIG